ncbi:hypothetical protein BTHE68_70410 (plasmid) [Burkholderia sp. THE68]|nr:hypothetical protein BTHE68_70410 [Burkholderia sp. THE68]
MIAPTTHSRIDGAHTQRIQMFDEQVAERQYVLLDGLDAKALNEPDHRGKRVHVWQIDVAEFEAQRVFSHGHVVGTRDIIGRRA